VEYIADAEESQLGEGSNAVIEGTDPGGVDGDGDEHNDDGDGDEDNEDDVPYTAADLVTVKQCVELMKHCTEVLKSGLGSMTYIADTVNNGSSGDSSLVRHCEAWVADMSGRFESLSNSITDLGAELYPPLLQPLVLVRYELLRIAVVDMIECMKDHVFDSIRPGDRITSLESLNELVGHSCLVPRSNF
jgi:Grap2 and cyclin-D-interacting